MLPSPGGCTAAPPCRLDRPEGLRRAHNATGGSKMSGLVGRQDLNRFTGVARWVFPRSERMNATPTEVALNLQLLGSPQSCLAEPSLALSGGGTAVGGCS